MTNVATRLQRAVPYAAALIAMFYGKRAALDSLRLRLVAGLSLRYEPGFSVWVNHQTSTTLRQYEPPAAHDTTILQLALNRPGPAGTAWPALREQLEAIIDDEHVQSPVWGYTLVYEALVADPQVFDTALSLVLPVVQRLHSAAPDPPPVLAHADVPGGHMWLVRVPLQNDGAQAATLYVALGVEGAEQSLVRTLLLGPNAELLMPDLVAHKAYHQMRQYRSHQLIDAYNQHVDSLRHAISHILDHPDHAAETTLEPLVHAYDQLVEAVLHLDSLHISLLQQRPNYDVWQHRSSGGEILAFHRNYLEMGILDMQHLVHKGSRMLDMAGDTIMVARTWLEKEAQRREQHARDRLHALRERERHAIEQRQQVLAALLAVMSMALAIPQLITWDVALLILHLWQIPPPDEGIGMLLPLGLQVLLTILFALLSGAGVWWYLGRQYDRVR